MPGQWELHCVLATVSCSESVMAEGCPNEDQGNEPDFVVVSRRLTSNNVEVSPNPAVVSPEASSYSGGDHLGPGSKPGGDESSSWAQPHTAVPPRRSTTCESAGDSMKLTDIERPDVGIKVDRN